MTGMTISFLVRIIEAAGGPISSGQRRLDWPIAATIEVVGATVVCSAQRSAGGMGCEGFLDRCGYLLGDAELVDHA